MMKIRIHIIIVLAGLSLCACHRDSNPIDIVSMEAAGVMEIEITENQHAPAEDKMQTVRFIVFKNASVLPVLELNELVDIPAPQPGDDDVSRFRVLLEVSRKPSGNNEKIVVAIINEPPTLTNELDALTNYVQLENVELHFADFLNTAHNALQTGKSMPMTGVLFTDKVYATLEEARADAVTLPVQRAVARVEIYINQETGMDTELATGTTITLENTYDREFFVQHQDGTSSFGKIATVTSGFTTKTWTWQSSDTKEIPEYETGKSGRLLACFYTPERTCQAAGNLDKLKINIRVQCSDGVSRSGELIVDRFRIDGTMTDVHSILRNNIYKVITTMTSNSLTSIVQDWNSEEIPTEF